MKVIFLDFDGVLNHEAFYRERQEKNFEGYPEYPFSEFDRHSIAVLNHIINATGAKVVVSSSWRVGRRPDELQEILETVGFTGEIIDVTPIIDKDYIVRGNEILTWVKLNKDLIGQEYHEFENYVILDDDSDMLYWQKDNFLHVDRYVGLTMYVAMKAIRILNRGRGMQILI